MKPLPFLHLVRPDGSRSKLCVTAAWSEILANDHVVEGTIDHVPVRMHHWDCRSRGEAENPAGTNFLASPGVLQIKGQKRKRAYGSVLLMILQTYACLRVERSAEDLQEALNTYLPGVTTYEHPVSADLWDVYFMDAHLTQRNLFDAAMALG